VRFTLVMNGTRVSLPRPCRSNMMLVITDIYDNNHAYHHSQLHFGTLSSLMGGVWVAQCCLFMKDDQVRNMCWSSNETLTVATGDAVLVSAVKYAATSILIAGTAEHFECIGSFLKVRVQMSSDEYVCE
jgi:hypothetical protein